MAGSHGDHVGLCDCRCYHVSACIRLDVIRIRSRQCWHLSGDSLRISHHHHAIRFLPRVHGLVWAAFLTMGGVILAMRRRMRDKGAAAAEIFSEDFLPLILLFSVSLTGLL